MNLLMTSLTKHGFTISFDAHDSGELTCEISPTSISEKFNGVYVEWPTEGKGFSCEDAFAACLRNVMISVSEEVDGLADQKRKLKRIASQLSISFEDLIKE